MQFKPVVLALGLVAAVQAWGNGTVYTTITTDIYTTVCPSPTSIVVGNQTYTVTESTTLTITNCPCTISTPVVPTTTYYPNSTIIVVPPPVSSVASTGIIPPPASTVPSGPSASASFVNAAPVKEASLGAIVLAGAAALFL
ncbi:clock-controlled protein 6 [Xylogone sp. PMI_703]|nr:clock-controlled protein 6 [Xylogone sp. PMI_703]